MNYKFKPLKNLHLYFMWIFYTFIVSFFDIGCILVSLDGFNIEYFIVCIIITVIPFLCYVIARLVYSYKYIISDEYLIKYNIYNKNVILKIKIKDIKCVIVKKANFCNYFKFIISLIIHYKLSTNNITTMSIVFEKYEIMEDFSEKDFKRIEVVDNKEIADKEYVEILPFNTIKKICKIMNLEYKLK